MAEAEAAGVHQAVVIMDRTTGTILTQLNADQPFPALSLAKLMIAADVLNGADPSGATNLDSTGAPAGTAAADGAGGSNDPGEPGASGSVDPSSATSSADPAIRAPVREMIIRSDDVTADSLYQQAGGDAMVDRITRRYALTGTTPTPDGVYWGNVQTTAADMASLLTQILADPGTASVIAPAMLATSAYAQDGVDQRIGMRTVPAAGSKQGWGCCLSGVVSIRRIYPGPHRRGAQRRSPGRRLTQRAGRARAASRSRSTGVHRGRHRNGPRRAGQSAAVRLRPTCQQIIANTRDGLAAARTSGRTEDAARS